MPRIRRLRRDVHGVSPVIATILLVAITVVLAAVLYVMITNLTAPVGQVDAMGINVLTTGENWTVQIVTVNPGKLPAVTYLIIRDPASGIALPPTPWSNLTSGNWNTYFAMYGDGSPAKPDIQPGDILLVSRLAYPAGYTMAISDDSKVLATRVF